MPRSSRLPLAAAAVTAFGLTLAPAAQATVYDVQMTFASGTVAGFIETDGTIGNLAMHNVVDWSLTFDSPNLFGGAPQVLTEANAFLNPHRGVIATASAIVIDLSSPTNINYLYVQQDVGPGDVYFLIHDYLCCAAPSYAAGATFGRVDSGNYSVAEHLGSVSTAYVIASAPIPEPGTLGLYAFGLAGLGATLRRRKAR